MFPNTYFPGTVYLGGGLGSGLSSALLEITDNEDGTGTATITGSTGTNTLYKATWDGVMSSEISWTSVGSRSGDGTIALSGVGFFLWIVGNSEDGFTSIIYQNITNLSGGTVSVVKQLMESVQTGIVSLNLSGISSVNVIERWLPRVLKDVEAASLPKVIICPWDRESFPGILTGKDDIGIPIIVVFVASQNQDNSANIDRNSQWRWATISYFRFQAPAGVSTSYGVYNCVPEVDVQVDSSWFLKGLYVSAFALRFITRTPRGLV